LAAPIPRRRDEAILYGPAVCSSLPALVPRARHTSTSVSFGKYATDPSTRAALTPPTWKLRAERLMSVGNVTLTDAWSGCFVSSQTMPMSSGQRHSIISGTGVLGGNAVENSWAPRPIVMSPIEPNQSLPLLGISSLLLIVSENNSVLLIPSVISLST